MPTPVPNHDMTQSKRRYPCPVCPKSFTRSEHRIRHERSHTLERPFACRYCPRKYARRDLVLRHEKTIHKEEYTKRACPVRKHGTSATDSALRTDDVMERSPSPSSLEATSPLQSASLNGSHRRSPTAPSGAFLTPQGSLDLILIDNFASVNGQNDPRKACQPSSPDAPTASRTYDIFPKIPQVPGLDCSEQQSTLTGGGLSEGQDEMEPYWSLLDVSPPFDVENGCDFPLGLRPLRNLSQVANAGKQAPTFLEQLFTPMENIQPDPLCSSLPTIVIRDRPRTKPVIFTEDMRQNMISDLLGLGFDLDIETAVPSATVIQSCVRSYFERFHIHHALFHPHTFNLNQMANPLVLAICAIGALYRLDRKLSAFLFCIAERALDMFSIKRDADAASPSFEEKVISSSIRQTAASPKPLWELQTRVLLVFVATIGGKPAFSRKAIDGIGFLACEYRILASHLSRGSGHHYTSWNHWIERESKKRVLHAILIISDLLNITFRIPPIISLFQEYDVDLPDDEILWHASTELDWMLSVQARNQGPLPSVQSAVSQLLYGGSPEKGIVPNQWSQCAVPVVMHAVSIHTWNLMQSAQIMTAVGLSLQDFQDPLTSHIETALSRCYRLISNARDVNEPTWNEVEGPLLFNSLSLLWGIHAQVLTGVGGLDHMILLSDVEEDMIAAVNHYVTQNSNWHPTSTKSARILFDSIMTILKPDAFVLRKTAAFNWSIEHALVGIDCAIFLSNCIQKIQINQKRRDDSNSAEELELLKMATDLLIDMDHVSDAQESLAAGVLRMWKQFYDDVWVWGVTPRIARLFEQLAQAYDEQLSSSP